MSESGASSMRYQVVHTTTYQYSEPVPLCHSEIHLTPCNCPRQKCLEHQLTIQPAPHKLDEYLDYFGNPTQYFTIQEQHLDISLTAARPLLLRREDVVVPNTTPP